LFFFCVGVPKKFHPLVGLSSLGLPKKERAFGVERGKSAAASPTKRMEQNHIFKFELTKQSSGMIP